MKLTRILICLTLALATTAFGQHPRVKRKPQDPAVFIGWVEPKAPSQSSKYVFLANVELGNIRPFQQLHRSHIPLTGADRAQITAIKVPKDKAVTAYRLLVADSKRFHYWLDIQNPRGKRETYFKIVKYISIGDIEQWNNKPFEMLRRHGVDGAGGSGDRGVQEIVVPESKAVEAYRLLVRDSKRHHTFLTIRNPKGKLETYFKLNEAAYEKWFKIQWKKDMASLVHIADVEQWNSEPIDCLQKADFSPSMMSDLGITAISIQKGPSTATAYKLLVQDGKRSHRWLRIRNPKGEWETYGKMNSSAYDKWVKEQTANHG